MKKEPVTYKQGIRIARKIASNKKLTEKEEELIEPYKVMKKEPAKHCKMCEEIIKGKPIIHDDYYFCSSECLGMYVSDEIEPEKEASDEE